MSDVKKMARNILKSVKLVQQLKKVSFKVGLVLRACCSVSSIWTDTKTSERKLSPILSETAVPISYQMIFEWG